MWSACVGVCQLLNWKMHGETLKFDTHLFGFQELIITQWFAAVTSLWIITLCIFLSVLIPLNSQLHCE